MEDGEVVIEIVVLVVVVAEADAPTEEVVDPEEVVVEAVADLVADKDPGIIRMPVPRALAKKIGSA